MIQDSCKELSPEAFLWGVKAHFHSTDPSGLISIKMFSGLVLTAASKCYTNSTKKEL